MAGTKLQTEVMAAEAVTRPLKPISPEATTRPLRPIDPSDATTDTLASRVLDPLDGTPYRTVAPLGEGGMGEVVLAEHRNLGHVVAVKLVRLDHGDEESRAEAIHPQLIERARIEAQAGARIRHENLVAVHGFDTTPAGRPYLVMEYLDGQTLQSRLVHAGGGPLPLLESIELVIQILRGLSAVHRAGLVHRDLKPSNIFLAAPSKEDVAAGKRKSTVKVLDLGLAKVVELTTAATPDPLKFPTKAGVVLGTPRYMAPEQVGASGLVDARADLYAVGLLRTRGGAPSPADREPPALESFESLGGRRVGGHLFLQASEPPWDFSNAVSAASYREMTAAFCELASPAQSVLAECKRLEALHHG